MTTTAHGSVPALEEADQSRGENGWPGQEISDGQIDKALVSVREGVSPAAVCEEHGFTYSGLQRRCEAAPELAEEAKRMGQGALERIIHDHARNGSPTERRLLNKTVRARKINPRLLTRILEQHNPNWRPGSKAEIPGTLTHQVKRNLTEAELETMLEAIDEAYPGGIAAMAEEGLAEKLGIPQPGEDRHPENSDQEPAPPALPPAPSDNGSAPAEEAA